MFESSQSNAIKLIKFVWPFLLALFSFDAMSCRTPFSGLALDKQIEVKPISGNSSYSIRLPAKIFPTSTKDANVYLKFEKVSDGKVNYQLTKELKLKNENEFLVGKVSVNGNPNYTPFIEAVWWPAKGEMCQSIGIKRLRMLP